MSNITVKNTVGKTYQHLTAMLWLFKPHNVLCSDSSEECTASIFRVTEQVQSDGRITVDYTRGLQRIWLITIIRKIEARPHPQYTTDKNSKKKTNAGPQPMAVLKSAELLGGWQCSEICFTYVSRGTELRQYCYKWQGYHAVGECLWPSYSRGMDLGLP
jgi:hypothetical protein